MHLNLFMEVLPASGIFSWKQPSRVYFDIATLQCLDRQNFNKVGEIEVRIRGIWSSNFER